MVCCCWPRSASTSCASADHLTASRWTSGAADDVTQTRLEWSDAIGKRVRSGNWADQAIPTLDKAREALAEAGDEFGLRAGRREVSAQLVDSFMEEAKVVYVIYKVWTAGFLGLARRPGRQRGGASSRDRPARGC